MKVAPNNKSRILSFVDNLSFGKRKLSIQKTIVPKIHLRLTALSGNIHSGSKYFKALVFSPEITLAPIRHKLACTILFFIDVFFRVL